MGFLCRGCHSKAQTGICPICLLRDMLQLRNQIRGLKNDSETVQAKMDDLLREKIVLDARNKRLLDVRRKIRVVQRRRESAEHRLMEAIGQCSQLSDRIACYSIRNATQDIMVFAEDAWNESNRYIAHRSHMLSCLSVDIDLRRAWAIMDVMHCIPSFEAFRPKPEKLKISDRAILEICSTENLASQYFVESIGLVYTFLTALCILLRIPLPVSCSTGPQSSPNHFLNIEQRNEYESRGARGIPFSRFKLFMNDHAKYCGGKIFGGEAFYFLRHAASVVSYDLSISPLPPRTIVTHPLEWFTSFCSAMLTEKQLSMINNKFVHKVMTILLPRIRTEIEQSCANTEDNMPSHDDTILEEWVLYENLGTDGAYHTVT